jgi:hypothetical protein
MRVEPVDLTNVEVTVADFARDPNVPAHGIEYSHDANGNPIPITLDANGYVIAALNTVTGEWH